MTPPAPPGYPGNDALPMPVLRRPVLGSHPADKGLRRCGCALLCADDEVDENVPALRPVGRPFRPNVAIGGRVAGLDLLASAPQPGVGEACRRPARTGERG